MQRQHFYLFTNACWVASSNVPSRQCGLATHHSHFTSASEDVRLDSKERAQFNGLANKLPSVHLMLNLALMLDDKPTDRSRNNKLYML